MDNPNYSQLELFSKASGHAEVRSGAFLKRIWAYEKAILTIIGFMVTAVISFSVGVEKGKNMANVRTAVRFDVAAKPAPAVVTAIPRRPQFQPVTQLPVKQPAAIRQDVLIPGYTIQLASYKNRSLAQKEADQLKKKGLSVSITSKGIFAVLCVGNFQTKETAQSMLSELEKQYRGCFIRRI